MKQSHETKQATDNTHCDERPSGLVVGHQLLAGSCTRSVSLSLSGRGHLQPYCVGWEVHDSETGERAAELMQRTVMTEQCFRKPLVLHSDNGSPMKSYTLQSKLADLGITPSHSRPRVSNDNAYSESLFRTLKYCPQWPSQGFASLDKARDWVKDFVSWYNHEHRHSRIKFVTPAQRHRGEDKGILEKRTTVYELARSRMPERGSGNTRNWSPAGAVALNPEKEEIKKVA